MSTSVRYTVQWQNQSPRTGDVFLFQQQPTIGVSNLFSLAWFSEHVHAATRGTFQWPVAYDFVWGETGALAPGVVFTASQTAPADLTSTNQITLAHTGDRYHFVNQDRGPHPGSLYITENGTIPPSAQAAVGIGMAGVGTFVVQTRPDANLVFTPAPTYWIAFGNAIVGQTLDIFAISNPMEITFPPGVTSMSTVFQANNTWTVPVATATAQKLFVERAELVSVDGRQPLTV
ncbi:MAG TPA: protein rhiA [Candidatus Dormibacteraeota bacterium]|jgi:hypothetical protein